MANQVLGRVASERQLGVDYTISRTSSGNLVCTCKAFQFNREQPKRCKHTACFKVEEVVRRPYPAVKPLADSIAFVMRSHVNRLVDGKGGVEELVAVAGSLRRHKQDVKDIDIVASLRDPDGALSALEKLAEVHVAPQTWTLVYCGVKAEIYLAPPDEYRMLLLWRTGSYKSNIRLAESARRLGRQITKHGVMEGRRRVAWETEESIFEACGVPFLRPWEREL